MKIHLRGKAREGAINQVTVAAADNCNSSIPTRAQCLVRYIQQRPSMHQTIHLYHHYPQLIAYPKYAITYMTMQVR